MIRRVFAADGEGRFQTRRGPQLWIAAVGLATGMVAFSAASGVASQTMKDQGGSSGPSAASSTSTQSQPATRPVTAARSRADLEAEFAALLTNAVLEGTWQATRVGESPNEAPLGPAMKDRYSILAAHKAEADWWLIRARIQYADHDVVLPVRVRVLWAGDTPVITVDETSFPGLGTYSARVLFHGPFYSGVWKGGGHGGVMSGRVIRDGAGGENRDPEHAGDDESP